jgi:hypothetical protein
MPIPVICACSAKLKVGDHLKGKHIKCPKCGALLPVGTVEGGSPAAPAPAPAAPPEAVLQQAPLSEAERASIEAEVEKDERLLWAGKPDLRAAFLRGLVFTIGLGAVALVLFIAIVSLAVAGGFKGAEGTIVAVVLVLAILAAVGAGAAAPYLFRWRMGKTFYAFTTKRAMAWDCDWGGKVSLHVYGPGDMAKLSLSSLSSGSGVGDLIFGLKARTKKTAQGNIKTFSRYGFFMVPQAAEVEKLLRETLVDPFLDKLYE